MFPFFFLMFKNILCYTGNDTVVETAVYQSAQECLTLLSNRLGDNQYMFGRWVPLPLDLFYYNFVAISQCCRTETNCSGSGSDFWQVLIPHPDPNPYPDHILQFEQKKLYKILSFYVRIRITAQKVVISFFSHDFFTFFIPFPFLIRIRKAFRFR
jgi:hypothetical protein